MRVRIQKRWMMAEEGKMQTATKNHHQMMISVTMANPISHNKPNNKTTLHPNHPPNNNNNNNPTSSK